MTQRSVLGLLATLAVTQNASAAEFEGRATGMVGMETNPTLAERGDPTVVPRAILESKLKLGLNLGGDQSWHETELLGTGGAKVSRNAPLDTFTGWLKARTVVNQEGNVGIGGQVDGGKKEKVAGWLDPSHPYVETDQIRGQGALQIHPHGKKAVLSAELAVDFHASEYSFGEDGQNQTRDRVWGPNAQVQYRFFPKTALSCEGGAQFLTPGESTLPFSATNAWSATCGINTLLDETEDYSRSGLNLHVGVGAVNPELEESHLTILGTAVGQLKVGKLIMSGDYTREVKESYPVPALEVVNQGTLGATWAGKGEKFKLGAICGYHWNKMNSAGTMGLETSWLVGERLDLAASAMVDVRDHSTNTKLFIGVVYTF